MIRQLFHYTSDEMHLCGLDIHEYLTQKFATFLSNNIDLLHELLPMTVFPDFDEKENDIFSHYLSLIDNFSFPNGNNDGNNDSDNDEGKRLPLEVLKNAFLKSAETESDRIYLILLERLRTRIEDKAQLEEIQQKAMYALFESGHDKRTANVLREMDQEQINSWLINITEHTTLRNDGALRQFLKYATNIDYVLEHCSNKDNLIFVQKAVEEFKILQEKGF